MLYITTQDIYSIVTTPNVDIEKQSDLIIIAIFAAKKQVPRCDKAFRLIKSSVDMLKTGMSTYYKDLVASGNPAIIIENFINDLSNDLHIDTQTLCQFKRIIFHFRKQADYMPKKYTKLEYVFSMLVKIMEIMERIIRKVSKKDKIMPKQYSKNIYIAIICVHIESTSVRTESTSVLI
jgi:hypothetical protein